MNQMINYFKEHPVFKSKYFIEALPKELSPAFDTCFLYPLPKFVDKKHYGEETEKVATELRILFLKDKIKEISSNLKTGEKEEDVRRIDILEKELFLLIGLLSNRKDVIK